MYALCSGLRGVNRTVYIYIYIIICIHLCQITNNINFEILIFHVIFEVPITFFCEKNKICN